MNFGVCLSDVIVPQSFIETLGKAIGLGVPDGVSIKMGCEVQKLADEIFERKFTNKRRTGRPGSGLEYKEDFNIYTEVARKINMPLIMFNNEYDRIVTPKANKFFFNGLKRSSRYISINSDKKMPHGRITDLKADFLADELAKFTYFNNPHIPIGKVFLHKLYTQLKKFKNVGCYEGYSLLKCVEHRSEINSKKKKFISDFCEVLSDTDKCIELKDILEGYDELYIKFMKVWEAEGRGASFKNIKRVVEEKNNDYYQWLFLEERIRPFEERVNIFK